VSAWPEGTVKISVTGDSAAGNPITISHDVTVDLATVAISINAIATDDVINAAEKGADLVLSGATTNVEAGQTVTISLNGKIYTATVDDSGNWTGDRTVCGSGTPEGRRRQRAGERHQRERQQRLGGPRVQRGCHRADRDHQHDRG
jgi:hypothetical protein